MASVGTRAASVGLLTLVAVACGGSDKATPSHATPFDHASGLLLGPPRQASCHPQAPRQQTDDEDPGGYTIYSFACSSDFELHDTRLKGIASVKDNVYGDGFHHVIDVFTKMGAELLVARRGSAITIQGVSNPDDPDAVRSEQGALLPSAQAILTGPTFEEWLDTNG